MLNEQNLDHRAPAADNGLVERLAEAFERAATGDLGTLSTLVDETSDGDESKARLTRSLALFANQVRSNLIEHEMLLAEMQLVQMDTEATNTKLRDEVEQRLAAERELVALHAQQIALEADQRRVLFEFLENIPVGIFVVDRDGAPVFCNPAAAGLLGEQPSRNAAATALADGRYLRKRSDDEPVATGIQPVRLALNGEHVSTEDFDLDVGDERVLLSIKASPILDGDGLICYGLAVYEDITERVRLHTERLQSQKLESIGQLAAGVAHEINTPMQYIGDNTTFLHKAFENILAMLDAYDAVVEDLGPEAREHLEARSKKLKLPYLRKRMPKAMRSTLDGIETVRDIVSAMKEFSHPGDTKKGPVDINHAIATTITVSRSAWRHCATVETAFDESLTNVPCLRSELNQVLLNMIVNSAHAIANKADNGSPESGRITISTRRDGAWAEIQVSDTGSGIPKQYLQKVFDPFFTTKEVGKGTGQGLAIARSIIVDKHDGTLNVASTQGEGTTFTIRLPL